MGAPEAVTAWLVVDQALDQTGAPLIFSTAILVVTDTDTDKLFEDSEYLAATEDEAMTQHHSLVDRLRRESG